MDTKVYDQVVKIISEHLDKQPSDVKPASRLAEDLGADSLDAVELAMAYEERFKIEIPTAKAQKVQTVQDTVDVIEEMIKESEK